MLLKTTGWRCTHVHSSAFLVGFRSHPGRCPPLIPAGSFEPASIYSTILPGKPSDLSGLAWGVEGRVWFGRRLGVQLQVAEASSTIGAINTPAGFTSGPTPAQVQFVTAQALYNFYPSPEDARLWLSAGTGVVRHGGVAYDHYGDPTQMAGVAGFGYAILIGHGLSATVGETTLLYLFDLPMPPGLERNPGSLEHGFQVDALLHLGLSWGWR